MNLSNERIGTQKERMASVFTRVERCQRAIEDDRWMAQRSKATAREISASHVPMLSHPDEVAHIILQAANTVVPA
jgi:hypothetical protein